MLLNRIDNQVAATYKDLPEKPRFTAKRFGSTPLDMAHVLRFVAPATHSDRTTW
jgi:hypothetical protein